jgi:hypothetical protein
VLSMSTSPTCRQHCLTCHHLILLPSPPQVAPAQQQMSAAQLGIKPQLPWMENFQVQQAQAAAAAAAAGTGSSSGAPVFQPEAPRTYWEAFKRQQRLMHGPDRREHKHVLRVGGAVGVLPAGACAGRVASAAGEWGCCPVHVDGDCLGRESYKQRSVQYRTARGVLRQRCTVWRYVAFSACKVCQARPGHPGALASHHFAPLWSS